MDAPLQERDTAPSPAPGATGTIWVGRGSPRTYVNHLGREGHQPPILHSGVGIGEGASVLSSFSPCPISWLWGLKLSKLASPNNTVTWPVPSHGNHHIDSCPALLLS